MRVEILGEDRRRRWWAMLTKTQADGLLDKQLTIL
jgi:hypothetical protein